MCRRPPRWVGRRVFLHARWGTAPRVFLEPPMRKRSSVCAISIPGGGVLIPPAAHTLDGFRTWALSDDYPERGEFHFLDQEIWIDLGQEELETHNLVRVEVGRALQNLNKRLKLGHLYGRGAFFTNDAANLATEPDALFVSYARLEKGRVKLMPSNRQPGDYRELRGSPDCVVEVISNNSVGKDTWRLRRLYHRAGIPEYWLIDARGETIDFQVLVRQKKGYEASVGKGGWPASPLFGRRFRLVRERGPLDLWVYDLQSKPLG
jgi:Uma2 family endonuclease